MLPELKLVSDKLLPFLTAFYLLPNSWFAGVVALGLGDLHYRFLILTAVAIVATALLMAGPLRSVAKGYSKFLTSLLESRRTQKSRLRLRTSLVSRLFKRRETRAGADFVFAYLWRDRRTKLRVFSLLGTPILGTPIIFLVVFFSDEPVWGWIGKPFTIWLAVGFSGFFFIIAGTFVGSILEQIRYSDHWKAKWMFSCAPLAAPHALWRGTLAASLVYIVVPYTLLFATLATIFWGGLWGIFYLLPGLSALLLYIGCYPKPSSGLPLSEEYIQSGRHMQSIRFLLRFVCSLFVFGTILFLQVAMYKINLGLYIGCYTVTVAAGFLIFIHTFNKKQEGDQPSE